MGTIEILQVWWHSCSLAVFAARILVTSQAYDFRSECDRVNQIAQALFTEVERNEYVPVYQGQRRVRHREIAEILCITEKIVKNHVTSILSRLNLRDRTQAAVFAHSAALLDS